MAKVNEKGWWFNYKGEAVHPDMVKVTDKIKDELIDEQIKKALNVRDTIASFRKDVENRVEAYFLLLLQEYGVDEKRRSKKGNLTLENFSATAKIEIRISETLSFDEKLQIAKMKVDEYLEDKTKDADPEIRILITKAFEVDKEGKIDAKKIFALKSYNIQDHRWKEAMSIIEEAKKIVSTKPYIRFYERENIDKPYRLIALNIADIQGE
jgi:hypothetical protein